MTNYKKFFFLVLASWLFFGLQPAAVFGETQEECYNRCISSEYAACMEEAEDPLLSEEETLREQDYCAIELDNCRKFCGGLGVPGAAGEAAAPAPDEPTGFIGGAEAQLRKTGEAAELGEALAQTPEQRASLVINAFLSVLGIAFLLLTTYGGLIWITARGDEARAEKARNIITRAVFGLLIIAAAYGITFFIFSRLVR